MPLVRALGPPLHHHGENVNRPISPASIAVAARLPARACVSSWRQQL